MTSTPPVRTITYTADVWTLLWWLSVTATLVVVGWFKSINLLLLLGYGLCLLLILNLIISRLAIKKFAVNRGEIPLIAAGEVCQVSIEIENRSKRPHTVMVYQQAEGDMISHRSSKWLLAPADPLQARYLTARYVFEKRGLHHVGPIIIESGYPFGLIWTSMVLAERAPVDVLPRIWKIDMDMFRRWMIRGGAGDAMMRRTMIRPKPGHGDVRGLRPYRTGDSQREIHWRTSARRNQLLVLEYDQTEPMDLVLVPDPWADRPEEHLAEERVDWVACVTFSIAYAWAQSGDGASMTLAVPGTTDQVITGQCTLAFVRKACQPLVHLHPLKKTMAVNTNLLRTRTNRVARVIVSTRPDSPLIEEYRRAGLTFAAIDATHPPVWLKSAMHTLSTNQKSI